MKFPLDFTEDDLPFIPDTEVDNPKKKIVGGVDAYIEDIPYQVSLRVLNETTGIWG